MNPFFSLLLLLILTSCRTYTYKPPADEHKVLREDVNVVAQSDERWTGIAVADAGQIFVCYPRWKKQHKFSVARVTGMNEVEPFPNLRWNQWDSSGNASGHFVCVQTVYLDNENNLWVLDTGNPFMEGLKEDGAKLISFDPLTGQLRQKITFNKPLLKDNSYLNDIRIDTEKGIAYLTDSGAGFLLVVDLNTGEAWKRLESHYSTKSEDIAISIDGKTWRRADGSLPSVHADGIALSDDKEYLFYQALTGKSLYSVPTRYLRDRDMPDTQLEAFVEHLDSVPVADGIIYGKDDNIYLTALEDKAITQYTSYGDTEPVVHDERLKWPDTFAWGPDGDLYVTTAQVHLEHPDEPFLIFRLSIQNKEDEP